MIQKRDWVHAYTFNITMTSIFRVSLTFDTEYTFEFMMDKNEGIRKSVQV